MQPYNTNPCRGGYGYLMESTVDAVHFIILKVRAHSFFTTQVITDPEEEYTHQVS